jgi:glutamyl-tRNA synthetase
VQRVKPLLQASGLWSNEYDHGSGREWLERVLRLVLPRVRRLPDFVVQASPFLTTSVDYDPEAVRKHLTPADLDQHIEALMAALEADAQPFEEGAIERVLRTVADARGIKAAQLIHAARIAVTGKAVSPGIFEVLALVGKPLTLSRLRDLARYLRDAR